MKTCPRCSNNLVYWANNWQTASPKHPIRLSQQTRSKKNHQGAVAPGNPDICVALKECPAKAVEFHASQLRSPSSRIAAMKVATTYIMVDSGATTSCANETALPQATVDPPCTQTRILAMQNKHMQNQVLCQDACAHQIPCPTNVASWMNSLMLILRPGAHTA